MLSGDLNLLMKNNGKLVLLFLVVPMSTCPFGKPVATKNASKLQLLFHLRQLRLWYSALSGTPAKLQRKVQKLKNGFLCH